MLESQCRVSETERTLTSERASERVERRGRERVRACVCLCFVEFQNFKPKTENQTIFHGQERWLKKLFCSSTAIFNVPVM